MPNNLFQHITTSSDIYSLTGKSNWKDFLLLHFRHNLRHAETFFKKIHSRGKHSKYYTSRVLYIPLYPTNLQIFGVKTFPRRRFLHHYYRDTFIESHRKPIVRPADVLALQGKNADNCKNIPQSMKIKQKRHLQNTL